MNFGRKQRSGSDSLQITVTMLFQLPLPEPFEFIQNIRKRGRQTGFSVMVVCGRGTVLELTCDAQGGRGIFA